MEKQYEVTEYKFGNATVRVHDPCLTEEAKAKRLERFKQACVVYMDKVIKQQIEQEQKEKELAATSSTKQNKTSKK